ATRRLILKAVQEHGSSTLANFYQQRLDAYFDTRRNLRFLLFPTPTARRRVMSDLAGVQRYLTDTERQVSEQLFHLIRKKDELDYQYALQLLLKMWLFIHLTLSYSLSVFVAWHVILTHAFHGGWR
ncbi:MAG: hypothetical protein KDA37_14945, partial [Planctomycetales bacterium]|nr:hypothetical protein [Planctomycetales bacterium]